MSRNSIKTKEETQQILQDSDFFNNSALSNVQVYFSGTWITPTNINSQSTRLGSSGPLLVATDNTIDLGNDDSLCLVSGMLRHIYGFPFQEIILDPHDDFPQNPSTSTFNHNLSYNLEIFILADKYDVPSLRTLAESAFMQELPNTLVDVILGDVC
ncbi:hypothetical protein KCU77_g2348, partial [Aureobasidium melanogenum]